MDPFEKLELSTETLRELNGEELERVAGGAKPVSQVNCWPFTDRCGNETLLCYSWAC